MKRKTIGLTLTVLAVISAVGVSAYLLGRSQSVDRKTDGKSTKTSTSNNKTSEDSTENGETKEPETITKTVTLYFSDSDAQYLVPEQRKISGTNDAGIYRAAVESLINGPTEAGHYRTVPQGMTIQAVSFENDVAMVDFGSSFASQYPAGTAGETLFIYSVVNTLTGFEEVKSVKFMVGGQTPEINNSRLNFTQGFARNDNLISP